MAKYRITAPDGSTYEVTAPDDATEAQVLAYAQQNYQQPASAAPAPAPGGLQSQGASGGNFAGGMDPTEGMSGFERFAAGAGKSVVDTGRGLLQIGAAAADQIPGVDLGGYRQDLRQRVAESRELDAPLMATGAGLAGNITGQIAQMAVPVGGAGAAAVGTLGRAAPYAAAATRAGAFSGVQPMAEGESRAVAAAQGAALGAAGQGVASGLGAVATRAREALTPVVRESIDAARAAGIPLHLSQVTDSRFLKGMTSVLNNLPFTGAARRSRQQQEAFNRAVSRTFGEDAPQITDDVLGAARQRLGQVYDNVFARNEVTLTPADIRRMASIESAAMRDLTADNAQVVRNQLQRILDDFQSGAVDGRKYQDLRGALAGLVDGSSTGKAIRALREALDDAAFRSVGREDAALLREANSMWANMRTAQDVLKQVSGASGDVRPASLWPAVRKGSTQEMRDLARMGQTVLKDPIPNSGTPERQMIMNLLGLGGAGYVAASDQMNPLLRLAATGILAGRVANSPGAARLLGQGAPANALAGLARPAPRLLPAAANANGPLVLDIAGGTPGEPVTVEELRRLRQRR